MDMEDVRYAVEITRTSSSSPATRGVYLRDLPDTISPEEVQLDAFISVVQVFKVLRISG
jgi:hypothetical protein